MSTHPLFNFRILREKVAVLLIFRKLCEDSCQCINFSTHYKIKQNIVYDKFLENLPEGFSTIFHSMGAKTQTLLILCNITN